MRAQVALMYWSDGPAASSVTVITRFCHNSGHAYPRVVNIWSAVRLAIAIACCACGSSQAESGARSATLDPVTLVSICVSNHRLNAASDSQTALGARPVKSITTFRACAWPPASYAAPDGYSEIVVTEYLWETHAEVTGASAPDLVTSKCAEIELGYTFQKQGPPSPATVRAVAGAVVDIFGKPWPPPGSSEALPFAYGRLDVVVVHNLSYAVDAARCVR